MFTFYDERKELYIFNLLLWFKLLIDIPWIEEQTDMEYTDVTVEVKLKIQEENESIKQQQQQGTPEVKSF